MTVAASTVAIAGPRPAGGPSLKTRADGKVSALIGGFGSLALATGPISACAGRFAGIVGVVVRARDLVAAPTLARAAMAGPTVSVVVCGPAPGRAAGGGIGVCPTLIAPMGTPEEASLVTLPAVILTLWRRRGGR